MPELRLAELLECTGGSLIRGEPHTVVGSFDIDTRRLRSGSVFFALKGERTDGHAFLAEAASAGAAAAVIEHPPAEDEPAPPALIRVDSVMDALTRCGGWVRRRSRNVKWIALTGSNGKTTTKELAAEGLSAERKVHRTPGNFNNHLGVPLSLLAMPDDTEIAVLELAMSSAGEIAELTKLVDPDIGLVTNVRAVHMDSFHSVDDIAAAKGELFAVMRDEGISVVNLDDVNVRVQSTRHAGRRITYGQTPSADLQLEELDNRYLPGASLTFRHADRSHRVQLRIGGAHAAHNALAALALVVAAGEDPFAAAERMERVEPGPGRGKVHRLDRDIMLIDDSYNSSPPALASVLEALRISEPRGRRVLVMGDMLELGPMKAALHREAGRRAAAAGIEVLVAVGPLAREAAETARRAGVGEVHVHADSADCAKTIEELLNDGDLVVVKGSRGIHLGRVVRALVGDGGGH